MGKTLRGKQLCYCYGFCSKGHQAMCAQKNPSLCVVIILEM